MRILEAANIEHWCAICNKLAGQRHHLYPRCRHRFMAGSIDDNVKLWREQIWVCRICHKRIHFLFQNVELAAKFNTVETLKPELEARLKAMPFLINQLSTRKRALLLE